jgi:hypothetical protein
MAGGLVYLVFVRHECLIHSFELSIMAGLRALFQHLLLLLVATMLVYVYEMGREGKHVVEILNGRDSWVDMVMKH